jgi:hypothetical protein
LALFLAIDHERGFKVQKKRGRPQKFDNKDLIRDVAEMRERKGLTSDKATLKALKCERPKQYSATIPSLLASLRKSRREERDAAKLREKLRASSGAFMREAMEVIEGRKRRV